jgi:hypothetical protein
MLSYSSSDKIKISWIGSSIPWSAPQFVPASLLRTFILLVAFASVICAFHVSRLSSVIPKICGRSSLQGSVHSIWFVGLGGRGFLSSDILKPFLLVQFDRLFIADWTFVCAVSISWSQVCMAQSSAYPTISTGSCTCFAMSANATNNRVTLITAPCTTSFSVWVFPITQLPSTTLNVMLSIKLRTKCSMFPRILLSASVWQCASSSMCHTISRGQRNHYKVLFFTEGFLNAGFQYYVYIWCGLISPKTILLLRYYFSVFECVEQGVINHFSNSLQTQLVSDIGR